LRASVGNLSNSNPELARSLSAILDGVDQDITAAVKGIEDWYDAAMDRVSGWYKRNVQRWILGIALVLTIARAVPG